MSVVFIGFILSSIFGVVSLFVYGSVWWTLYHNWKHFKTPYFQLFVLASVLNVISYLTTWPLLHLANVTCKDCILAPFFQQEYFFGLTTLRFIFRYCTQESCVIEVALALNRFTAIALYGNHSKIWYKILLPVFVLVLVVPVSLSYNSYIFPSYIRYDSIADNYYFGSKENASTRSMTLAINQLICSILVICLGTTTVFFLFKNRKIPQRSLEIKLFVHSIISFLVMLSLVFFAVLYNQSLSCAPDCWYYANSSHIQQYVLDFQNLTSPYMLILCSPKLRRRLPFWRKKMLTPVLSVSHNSQTRM